MFRSIMLVGVLAATFILALVSCNSPAEPPTSPPAAPTEPPTPTPMPEHLEETIPPCIPPPGSTVDPCAANVNIIGHGGSDFQAYPPELPPRSIGDYLAGSSEAKVAHMVLRGTFLPGTVRCDAGYTYNEPAYLRTEAGELAFSWTFENSTILHCFADARVSEYIVGSGPATLTLELTHDLTLPSGGGQAALDAFEGLWERVLIEGGHNVPLSALQANPLLSGISANLFYWGGPFAGVEGILFVGPLSNKNVEAWKLTDWWNVERKDNDTVVAVHPERQRRTAEDVEARRSTLEIPLATFKQSALAAHTARSTANGGRTRSGSGYPMLVTDANNLRQFFTEIGAYDDPANPPQHPPAAYECDDTTAVTSPGVNRGLVQDCESLLDSKDTLRGTASLNWSAGTAVTGWDGVTVTDDRITKLELDDEGLSGTIPPALGNLPSLTHLDLSDNSLTGAIPRELAHLDNLQVLRLSGNSLTGCIPEGLKDVATNDLNSLNLQACPAAPSNPSVRTPGEASVTLTWSAVANNSKYRVEYHRG